MNPTPRVPPEQLVESMKEEIEQYVKEVMETATSFAKAAANLARTAQVTLSAEQLRKEVEQEMGRIGCSSVKPPNASPSSMERRGFASRCSCIWPSWTG